MVLPRRFVKAPQGGAIIHTIPVRAKTIRELYLILNCSLFSYNQNLSLWKLFCIYSTPLWLQLHKGRLFWDNGFYIYCLLEQGATYSFSLTIFYEREKEERSHSPGQTTVLLQGRFSRRDPVQVVQMRVRLWDPSPQVTEHELQEDHSSVLASDSGVNMN